MGLFTVMQKQILKNLKLNKEEKGMKFRNGFVTNSSSSSFICEVCGHDESGWDMCNSKAGMIGCENGHTFCERHVSDPDKIALLLEFTNSQTLMYQQKQKNENLTKRENLDIEEKLEDLAEDLKNIKKGVTYPYFEDLLDREDYRDYFPASKCPICSMGTILDTDLITFALQKLNVSKDELSKMFKDSYKDLAEFHNKNKKLDK